MNSASPICWDRLVEYKLIISCIPLVEFRIDVKTVGCRIYAVGNGEVVLSINGDVLKVVGPLGVNTGNVVKTRSIPLVNL